jgi:putative FmdB family regulatory protein
VPIYEYKCDNGHVFDVIQRMSDDALTECQECGAPAVRVLHPVAVHFKGSGFYNTDYGKKKKGANGGSSGEGSGESKDSSDSKGSSESKGSESKSSDSKSSGDSKSKASTTSD